MKPLASYEGMQTTTDPQEHELEQDNEGPCEMVHVFDNGTVTQFMGTQFMGANLDRINVR